MRTIARRSFLTVSVIVALLVFQDGLATSLGEIGNQDQAPASRDIVLLVLFVSLAIGVSFLCSVAEAVLLSITPSYIEGQKDKRPRLAARLKRLKQDNIDRSLAAILTLNTIAHTVGAVEAGAKAHIVFGSAWIGVFSALITLMILFLSEIVPKTIGAVYWAKLTSPVSIFIRGLIVILFPFVWISERITRMISRDKDLDIFTRDEFVAMASVATKTGEIGRKESRIIQNLLRFDSLNVTDIMTPRTVVTALPEDMTINDSLEQVTQTPFSRLPIYAKKLDYISGFVLKDDVLISSAQERGGEILKVLKREILAVPDSVSLSALLERFLKDRQHIAIVINEHGGVDGIVTLEDLIETLMGTEIMDETDSVEDMRALARRRWVQRAKAMGINANMILHKTAAPSGSRDGET